MMKILDLDGSYYERGRRQGRMMRKQYKQLMNDFFSSEMWDENKPDFVPNAIAMRALGLLGSVSIKNVVRNNLPVQTERIRGLAKGLGVSERVCWGLQFMEILMCEAGKTLKVPAGCTQIHAAPEATADGKPLSARNYDFPNMLKPYQIIRREVPSESGRYAATSITQVPLAGAHHGINEHGLMICVNNARLWKGKDLRFRGVPYQLILMEALETCRTTFEAVELITKFPARANAGFFGIVDADGFTRVVEFTASRYVVREPDESGVMAQTNHYIKMPEANLPPGTYFTVKGMEGMEYAYSTETRHHAAFKKLKDAAGKITVETMMDILKDHSANKGAGSDFTVCCHGITGGTLGSMVVDPRDKKMWVAEGNPCSNAFQPVEFRSSPLKKRDYYLIGKNTISFLVGSYGLYKTGKSLHELIKK